ncbi:hypothetical protein EJ08DRAFT_78879 [Tothia fuscella]|uniref:Uncharacterized protein n=1 Tax=Tothia fuscella TaxID=1048955 RepID=A0A9P4NXG0_9PEZI|nr:hypothetical protein EJ08DRAFT_78879 [Tothia fuscella]
MPSIVLSGYIDRLAGYDGSCVCFVTSGVFVLPFSLFLHQVWLRSIFSNESLCPPIMTQSCFSLLVIVICSAVKMG